MTDTEFLEEIEKEVTKLRYSIETTTNIYDNPGLKKIYENKFLNLNRLLQLGKKWVGKESAKKVQNIDKLVGVEFGICPACTERSFYHSPYCHHCGQKLEWED